MKSYCKRITERLDKTMVKFKKEVNESQINEKYPAEFKDISNLERISYVLTKAGIDIERSSIEPLEVKSGHDPKLKDAGYVIAVSKGVGIRKGDGIRKVAGLAKVEGGKRENLIDAEFIISDDKVKFKYLSWKKLLDAGIKLYFISAAASNADIKAERKAAKEGAVGLDRDEKKQKLDYVSPYDGTKHYSSARGYDKSGYKLDTDKYKNMLREIKANDGSWKQDAEAAINEYESYIDVLKSSPRGTSQGMASKFLGRWGGPSYYFSSVASLAEAIEKVFRDASELDEIKGNNKMNAREKEIELNWKKRDLESAIGNLRSERKRVAERMAELEKKAD